MKNIQNRIANFFGELTFNEKYHKYSVGGTPISISVSGLIGRYKYPVNWDSIKLGVSLKRGISVQEVEAEWAAAAKLGCDIGDKTHIFAENYAMNRSLKPTTGYEEAVVKFWNDLPDFVVPVGLEVKMYHKEKMFAGTADLLFYNKNTGKYVIGDYKSNREIFNNFKDQKMQAPFENMLCENFSHYTLQMNYYQIMIEQIPGIEVSHRKLIWVKSDGTYSIYDVDNLTEKLRGEIKNYNL